MTPKHTERQKAQDLYFNTPMTQQEIADILNVNRRTVYLWIKHGKWEEMKEATRQAPGIILQNMYSHVTAINDRIFNREDPCPTMQEVEMLRKLMGITTSMKKNHCGSYIQAFEELVFYIAREDADLGKRVTEHATNYITGNFGDEGFHMTKARKENIARVVTNLEKRKEQLSRDQENDSVVYNNPSSGRSFDLPDQGSQDNNAISKTRSHESPDRSKPFPAGTYENNSNTIGYRTASFLEDVISHPISSPLDRVLHLPPAERPSPFRDGNELWVNDPDDVDERYDNFGNSWGERKMGDIIRRYSIVDDACRRA